MVEPEIFAQRATYSALRVEELRRRLSSRPETSALPGLTVFCAGSYARMEASEYSDIDLFFVYGDPDGASSRSNIDEIRLFSAVIETANNMGFPAFSNDGQYLCTRECSSILEHMGSPADDSLNLFTLRMLLLLESKCLVGDGIFDDVQRRVVSAYYRDYPDHQATFEPWFLINDIGRFWKTLLLNYEHKRNQPPEHEIQKNKQKVRNFKLKYSRMTTCFATIAALASLENSPSEEQILQIVQRTPRERLDAVRVSLPQVAEKVRAVLDQYSWFLEQTAQTEEQLRSGFEDKKHRSERFERANNYGDAMFDLISAIGESRDSADSNRLLRYLVI
ncbi:nucleotidyltransferase domain-containing protein [Mycolicibacterium vanbaalenii]|uniref:nucleotidyltransferase domain-containing protein n=1 Tax=Mycolicibacterium vanbaalenii TaxID=110539 RepID=UPI001330BE66|nr:nucleotidyltransferase domain-containing protein [Mycolicibacterium vanbaalenii]